MTLLQQRQPDFPEHPEDGFEIKEELPDGGYVVWEYSAQFNEWTYTIHKAALDGFIYTDQVRTRGEEAPAAKGAEDVPELLTQRDVNHYLNDKGGGGADGDYLPLSGGDVSGNIRFDGGGSLGAVDNGTGFVTLHFESGAVKYNGWYTHDEHLVTKKRLEDYATKEELAALQAQVDNLSGLLIQARYEQGTGITTRPGEFVIVANDTQQNRFSQGTELRLYETDLDGKSPALTRVIAGDTIHIADPYGASCSMEVTYAAGTVIRYSNVIGTLDRISDRTPYSFRISGQA